MRTCVQLRGIIIVPGTMYIIMYTVYISPCLHMYIATCLIYESVMLRGLYHPPIANNYYFTVQRIN